MPHENETHPIKPLSQKFRKGGFDFIMLRRTGDIALFRKQKPGTEIIGYEVVIVQKNRPRIIAGNFFPASESLPYSEQWGTCGWTYRTQDSADKRYEQLVEANDNAVSYSVLSETTGFYGAGSMTTADRGFAA